MYDITGHWSDVGEVNSCCCYGTSFIYRSNKITSACIERNHATNRVSYACVQAMVTEGRKYGAHITTCHILFTHGVIRMLFVFQVTGSCRVMNLSPPRFRLNSSPREAAYNTRAEKVTKSRQATKQQRESCTQATMKISNLYIMK